MLTLTMIGEKKKSASIPAIPPHPERMRSGGKKKQQNQKSRSGNSRQEGLMTGQYAPSKKTLGLELVASPDLLAKNEWMYLNERQRQQQANRVNEESVAPSMASTVVASGGNNTHVSSQGSKSSGQSADEEQRQASPALVTPPIAAAKKVSAFPKIRRLGTSSRDTAPRSAPKASKSSIATAATRSAPSKILSKARKERGNDYEAEEGVIAAALARMAVTPDKMDTKAAPLRQDQAVSSARSSTAMTSAQGGQSKSSSRDGSNAHSSSFPKIRPLFASQRDTPYGGSSKAGKNAARNNKPASKTAPKTALSNKKNRIQTQMRIRKQERMAQQQEHEQQEESNVERQHHIIDDRQQQLVVKKNDSMRERADWQMEEARGVLERNSQQARQQEESEQDQTPDEEAQNFDRSNRSSSEQRPDSQSNNILGMSHISDSSSVQERAAQACCVDAILDDLDEPFGDDDDDDEYGSDDEETDDVRNNNPESLPSSSAAGNDVATVEPGSVERPLSRQQQGMFASPCSEGTSPSRQKAFLKSRGLEGIRAARAGRLRSFFKGATSKRTFKAVSSAAKAGVGLPGSLAGKGGDVVEDAGDDEIEAATTSNPSQNSPYDSSNSSSNDLCAESPFDEEQAEKSLSDSHIERVLQGEHSSNNSKSSNSSKSHNTPSSSAMISPKQLKFSLAALPSTLAAAAWPQQSLEHEKSQTDQQKPHNQGDPVALTKSWSKLPSPAEIRDRRAKKTVQERLKAKEEELGKHKKLQMEASRKLRNERRRGLARHPPVGDDGDNSIMGSPISEIPSVNGRTVNPVAGGNSTPAQMRTPRASPAPSPTDPDPTVLNLFCTPKVSSSEIHTQQPASANACAGMTMGGALRGVGGANEFAEDYAMCSNMGVSAEATTLKKGNKSTKSLLDTTTSSTDSHLRGMADADAAAVSPVAPSEKMKRVQSYDSPTGVEELTLSMHHQVVQNGRKDDSGLSDVEEEKEAPYDAVPHEGGDDDQTWNSEDTEKTANTRDTLEKQQLMARTLSQISAAKATGERSSKDDVALSKVFGNGGIAQSKTKAEPKKEKAVFLADVSGDVEVVVMPLEEETDGCNPCDAVMCTAPDCEIEVVDEISKWFSECWTNENDKEEIDDNDHHEGHFGEEEEEEYELHQRLYQEVFSATQEEEEEEFRPTPRREVFNATWDGRPSDEETTSEDDTSSSKKEKDTPFIVESKNVQTQADGDAAAPPELSFVPSWDRVEKALSDTQNRLPPSSEDNIGELQLKTDIKSSSASNIELELLGGGAKDVDVLLRSNHRSKGLSSASSSGNNNEDDNAIDELIRKDLRLVERTFSGEESSSPGSKAGYSVMSLEAQELLGLIADNDEDKFWTDEGEVEADGGGEDKDCTPPDIKRKNLKNLQPMELFKYRGSVGDNEEEGRGDDDGDGADNRTISTIHSMPTFQEDNSTKPATVDMNATFEEDDDKSTRDGTGTISVGSTLDNSTLTSRDTKGTKESTPMVLIEQNRLAMLAGSLGCNYPEHMTDDGSASRVLMGIQPRCDTMHGMAPSLPLNTVPSFAVAQGCNAMPMATPLVPTQWIDGFNQVHNNVLDVVDRIDYAINGNMSDSDDDDTTIYSDDRTEDMELRDIHNKKGGRRSRNSRKYHHRNISGGSGKDNDAAAGGRRSLNERSREYNRRRKRRERRVSNRRGRAQSPSLSCGMAGVLSAGDTEATEVLAKTEAEDPTQRDYQVRFSPSTNPSFLDGEGAGTGAVGDAAGDLVGAVDGDRAMPEDGVADNEAKAPPFSWEGAGAAADDDNDSFDNVHQLHLLSSEIPPSPLPPAVTTATDAVVVSASTAVDNSRPPRPTMQGKDGRRDDERSVRTGGSAASRISRSISKKRSFPNIKIKREWSGKASGSVGGAGSVDFSAKGSQ